MEILLFGQLADITGAAKTEIDTVADTDGLKEMLEERFPGLKQVKYMVAVNKRIVQTNISLDGSETIALMPPFSGG
jgi:molybdopterin synthase sulfur carrier subunit